MRTLSECTREVDPQVRIKATQDSLVTNDQNVLLPLEFKDDWLETNYNIPVRLATTVPVIELVIIARCVIFRVRYL